LLTHLTIKNYALIDDLSVSFDKGFSTITGETGAGKSIFLGGLALVLGKRADLASLRDHTRKCTIEAEFSIENYELEFLFDAFDLDYESQTILRREIQPSGKSRAFVNDTPVTLDILTKLGQRLIDIHSQHQTLELTENDFQLKVIDALAGNSKLLLSYNEYFSKHKEIQRELDTLLETQRNAIKEQDYTAFLLNELQETPLQAGILEELESDYAELVNVESILEQLSKGHQVLTTDQAGVNPMLLELKNASAKLATISPKYDSLHERIQSVFLELDDITSEIESLQDAVEANPGLLDEINERLQVLHNLQKKHGVGTIEELIEIREDLKRKVEISENVEFEIEEKQTLLSNTELTLVELGQQLHRKREQVAPLLKRQLEEALEPLGMQNATFKIELQYTEEFKTSGMDQLMFLFSANRGTVYGPLKKVASGGELSRIMLVIKSILATYEQLPTMMFDEIDTGVSGEISNNMGDIMSQMSTSMQIFSITHLPQVASKGDHHYKVYKEDDNLVTHTKMKKLNIEERVKEVAEMLGGKDLSASAMAHARQLLN